MKVLVVGASGFIGRAVVRALRARGDDVVACGRAWEREAASRGDASTVEAAKDGEGSRHAGQGSGHGGETSRHRSEGSLHAGGAQVRELFDAVVWAGGNKSADAAESCEMHVAGPLRAQRWLVPGGAMVYLSSGELYAACPVPFREDAEVAPQSMYARDKRAGEQALLAAAAAGGTRCVCLRLAVVYGPGQRGAMLLPAVRAAIADGTVLSLSPGEQTRDFVHVEDVVSGVVAALDRPNATGIINLGSGREVVVRAVVEELLRHAGAPATLAAWGAAPYREHEQMRYVMDLSRAAAVLGWRPQVALGDGLASLLGPEPGGSTQ